MASLNVSQRAFVSEKNILLALILNCVRCRRRCRLFFVCLFVFFFLFKRRFFFLNNVLFSRIFRSLIITVIDFRIRNDVIYLAPNIGTKFQLINKLLPRGNKLHEVVSRFTLKVSYSCMKKKNVKQI